MSQARTCLHKLQDCCARSRALSPFPATFKPVVYLQCMPERRLSLTGRFCQREIVGSVRAGFPSPANEGLADTISIDEYLVEQPDCTVLLTIKGDSMIDAGFMPGDVVIVEKGAPAGIGDIVVAIIDNEFTVKYLEKDPQGFYLNPANPAYPPIRPKDQLEIYGVVAGLFRKYKRRR